MWVGMAEEGGFAANAAQLQILVAHKSASDRPVRAKSSASALKLHKLGRPSAISA